MQRLRSAENGCCCLNCGSSYVVERVLLGKAPTAGLAVGAQGERFFILRVELFYNLCPQHTCGAHFCDFHKVVHPDGPKEREPRRKSVYIHSRFYSCADVFQTVGKGVCKFNICRGSRFLHMVTGDGNAIELGHILGSKLKNITDNFHGWCRRINVSIPHHEFL